MTEALPLQHVVTADHTLTGSCAAKYRVKTRAMRLAVTFCAGGYGMPPDLCVDQCALVADAARIRTDAGSVGHDSDSCARSIIPCDAGLARLCKSTRNAFQLDGQNSEPKAMRKPCHFALTIKHYRRVVYFVPLRNARYFESLDPDHIIFSM